MSKLNYSIDWSKAVDDADDESMKQQSGAADALDKQKTIMMGLQKQGASAPQTQIIQTTSGFGRTV